MSSNRLTYDNCEYKERLNESASTVQYLLDVNKYEHKKRCRNKLGLVGGVEVQEIQKNLVDLESELRGQYKMQSLCPEARHSMFNNGLTKDVEVKQQVCKKSRNVKTQFRKIKSCQFIDFRNVGMEGCPDLNKMNK